MLDDVTGEVTFNITHGGFDEPEIFAHVHGPANPNQNAPVIYGLGPIGSPKIGSSAPVLLNAGQMTDMLNGLHYVNIHTTPHPGGEIRGQVLVPEPSAIALALVGLLALSVRGRRHLGRLR